MSGSLSVFSLASEAVSAISSLAFGATDGVVLGEFCFSSYEVPEFITIGGEQAQIVHKMPGGARVVDVLGPDDRDIEWSGEIIDGGPEARAQQLDQMRIDGATLPLCWGTFYYTVVIKHFSAEMRYSRARYRIACTVLRDEAVSTAEDEDLTSTDSAVTDDLSSASDSAPAATKASTTAAQQSLPEPPAGVDAPAAATEATPAAEIQVSVPRTAGVEPVVFQPVEMPASIPTQQPPGSEIQFAPAVGVDQSSSYFHSTDYGAIGPLRIGP